MENNAIPPSETPSTDHLESPELLRPLQRHPTVKTIDSC